MLFDDLIRNPIFLRRKAVSLTKHKLSAHLLEGFPELIYHPGTSGNIDVHYQDREMLGAVCCTASEAMLIYHATRLCNPQHALEIGSYIGWSSAHLASGLTNSHLTCIDPFMETAGQADGNGATATIAYHRFLRNIQRVGVSDRINLVRGRSPDKLHELSMNKQWDLVYVDGWHLQGQPLKDVIGVLPFVSQPCVLILHDLWIADVRDALLYLRISGWSYKIFDTANYLTILWRGEIPLWAEELFNISCQKEYVLPSAQAKKFVFGLVDDSIQEAESAFGNRI